MTICLYSLVFYANGLQVTFAFASACRKCKIFEKLWRKCEVLNGSDDRVVKASDSVAVDFGSISSRAKPV